MASIIGTTGNNTLVGGAENDTIIANAGNDSLDAGAGNDWLYGGEGNDSLTGGAGNDTLYSDYGPTEELIVNGTFSAGFSGWQVGNPSGGFAPLVSSGVATFNIGGESVYGDFIQQSFASMVGETYFASFRGMENNTGTADHTVLVEIYDDSGAVIFSQTEVIANGSNRLISFNFVATTAQSTLRLTNSSSTNSVNTDLKIDNVSVIGPGFKSGADRLLGGDGDDVLYAGAGNDTFNGNAGNDSIFAGDGDDMSLASDLGDDLMYGGAGNDTLSGDLGQDVLHGELGDDVLEGHDGADTLYGGLGNDYLIGGDIQGITDATARGLTPLFGVDDGAQDYLEGGEGDDTALGALGDDTLRGGAGQDALLGGGGRDLLVGDVGLDTLYGEAGDDSLQAGAGDLVYGGDGDDLITLDAALVDQAGAIIIYGGDSASEEALVDSANNPLVAGVARLGDVLDLRGLTDVTVVPLSIGAQDGTATFRNALNQQVTISYFDIEHVLFTQDLPALGVVDGTDSAEVIDLSFVDAQGDRVDDAIGDNDVIKARGGNDTVNASLGDDTIYAGDGDDVVTGAAGRDLIYGDGGKDTVYGGDGDDNIDGGAGNDSLVAGRGSDSVYGGDGNDLINTRNSASESLPDIGLYHPNPSLRYPADGVPLDDRDLVFGGAGDDTILTGDDRDQIYAGAGQDSIDAGYDDDMVDAGDGGDSIAGGEGRDTVYGGLGDDIVFGGLASTDPNLAALSVLDMVDAGGVDPEPNNSTDLLYGGDGLDRLYGGEDADTLYGGADRDTLYGEIDNDLLQGDDGNDLIYGGQGADQLSGGAGNDLAYGGGENDLISGGAGQDTLGGDLGDDTLYGDLDHDVIEGHDGRDAIYGGDGNDYLAGAAITAISDALSRGLDPVWAGDDNARDTLDGGQGDDSLLGAGGDDLLDGGAGADALIGGQGNDVIYAGAGSDQMTGSQGNDTLYGGDGDDGSFAGDLGDDLIYGGAGADLLGGDLGHDTIYGDLGDDLIEGNSGADALYGGEGNDFVLGGETLGIADFLPSGEIVLTWGETDAGNDYLDGGAGDDIVMADLGDDTLVGGAGDDLLIGNSGHDRLFGGLGNDILLAADGHDVLDAGDGNDLLEAADGNDTSYGGAGDDSMATGDLGDDLVYGGDGQDILGGDLGQDTIYGDAGQDVLEGHGGNDQLYGGEGNDYITGGDILFIADPAARSLAPTWETLDIGDDYLEGGAGNDTLLGAIGRDTLLGGAGNDALVGGDGADVFVLEGADTIADFDATSGISGNGTTDNDFADLSLFYNAANLALWNAANPSNTFASPLLWLRADQADGVLQSAGGAQIQMGGLAVAASLLNSENTGVSAATIALPPPPAAGVLLRGTPGPDVLTAGTGRDTLIGDTGDDLLYAGDGNDRLDAGGGNDTLYAGAGDDLMLANDFGDDLVYGGAGQDILSGDLGNDSIYGDDGQDVIEGHSGADLLFGGAGNDYITGGDVVGISDPSARTLAPEWGADDGAGDYLDGGAGDDTLLGAMGRDTLDGGAGNDALIGGDGADVFLVQGADTITDFNTSAGIAGNGNQDNDFVDLSAHYNPITLAAWNAANPGNQFASVLQWLRADQADGVLQAAGGLQIKSGGVAVSGDALNRENTAVCFVAGTRLATARGHRPIEKLRVGDLVETLDHGLQPIRWIGHMQVAASGDLAPIRICAGALQNRRDILVSPLHRMLVSGWQVELMFGEAQVLAAAKMLVNGTSIYPEPRAQVTYYHLMFDQHEVVFAEGAASESFHPGSEGFDALGDAARAQIYAAFPYLQNQDFAAYGPSARRSLRAHEARLLKIGRNLISTAQLNHAPHRRAMAAQ